MMNSIKCMFIYLVLWILDSYKYNFGINYLRIKTLYK